MGSDRLKNIPGWLVSALLYGFSWSMMAGINLSFLAWFAWVPLFFSLEARTSFRAFFLPCFLFAFTTSISNCHGFFLVPVDRILFGAGAVEEAILSSVPYLLLYLIKKITGYKKALLVFPLIIFLWEFTYQKLDHSFGYLMISHSQCQNIWLIQFIDIFGVWAIGAWVMAFNVMLYFALKRQHINTFCRSSMIRILIYSCLFLIPPVSYSAYRLHGDASKQKEKINVTLINTHFPLQPEKGYEDYVRKIERLTHITDSADYELNKSNRSTDLYVWHEAAVDHGNDSLFYSFIDSAVRDWHTPLLTGMRLVPVNAGKDDRRAVNRAVLIEPGRNCHDYQYYDKVILAPGHEKIPYHKFLSRLPFFPVPYNDPGYLKAARKVCLIRLNVRDGRSVKIGTPICMEQNYSAIWSDMAFMGAACFIQLSYESWWPTEYFKKQMADITRLRCIETHRCTGRCSNGGITEVIDDYGRIIKASPPGDYALNADLFLNHPLTFFSRHQSLFVYISFILVGLYLIYETIITCLKRSRADK